MEVDEIVVVGAFCWWKLGGVGEGLGFLGRLDLEVLEVRRSLVFGSYIALRTVSC